MEHDVVDVQVATRRQVAGHDLQGQAEPLRVATWIAPNRRQPVFSTVQPRVLEPGIGWPSLYSRRPMVTVAPAADGFAQALVW